MDVRFLLGETFKRTKINKFAYRNKFTLSLLSPQKINITSESQARNKLSNFSAKPVGSSVAYNNLSKAVYDLKIIIPAYNAELYIDACLISVINQKTDFTFTVDVINDGSTDSTEKILHKYKNHPQINIINQSNKGHSGARNTGLNEINSKYLMFVDADDKLENNAIQTLLSLAIKNDSDIVEGGYYNFDKNKILNKSVHKFSSDVNPFGYIRGFPWGKVIKSSIFQNIKFPEGYWYEDTIFAYLIFPRCNNVSTITDIVYWYRYNPQGISVMSKKKNKCIDSYWILEQMLEDMRELGIEKTQDIYEQTLRQIHIAFKRAKFMDNEIKKSLFVLTSRLIQTEFIDYQTNNHFYSELETSLKDSDFNKFYIFCLLF